MTIDVKNEKLCDMPFVLHTRKDVEKFDLVGANVEEEGGRSTEIIFWYLTQTRVVLGRIFLPYSYLTFDHRGAKYSPTP